MRYGLFSALFNSEIAQQRVVLKYTGSMAIFPYSIYPFVIRMTHPMSLSLSLPLSYPVMILISSTSLKVSSNIDAIDEPTPMIQRMYVCMYVCVCVCVCVCSIIPASPSLRVRGEG